MGLRHLAQIKIAIGIGLQARHLHERVQRDIDAREAGTGPLPEGLFPGPQVKPFDAHGKTACKPGSRKCGADGGTRTRMTEVEGF
jgi:hypothetical protein